MKKKKSTMKGLVLCFTGAGKGKTTAALGMVMRALAHKKRVLFVQFIKSSSSGEIDFLSQFAPQVSIHRFGLGFVPVKSEKRLAQHKDIITKGYQFVRQMYKARKRFDLIVLDEIHLATKLKLLSVKDVETLIEEKPRNTHLVLTGRYAHKKIRERSDLVTEMKAKKHHFAAGIQAQKGIEY